MTGLADAGLEKTSEFPPPPEKPEPHTIIVPDAERRSPYDSLVSAAITGGVVATQDGMPCSPARVTAS